MEKRRLTIWLVVVVTLLWLGIGVGRAQAVSCSGNLSCTIWDDGLGVCGPDKEFIPCVQSGSACLWQFDCNGCDASGSDCSDLDASPTPVPSGVWTAKECSVTKKPWCQTGICPNGKACNGIGTGDDCGCSGGYTCDDVVGEPTSLTISRITSTSALATWPRPSNIYAKVNRQSFVVAKNLVAAINCSGTMLSPAVHEPACIIDEQNLAPTVGSYSISGLQEGRYYYVRITYWADNVINQIDCTAGKGEQYLSSCRFEISDPDQVDVGQTITLHTDVLDPPNPVTFNVLYAITSGAASLAFTTPAILNLNPDTTYPHSINVTGVADGTATVRGSVRVGLAGTTSICSSTTTVNVGSVVVPANPWWQTIGGSVHTQRTTGTVLRSRLPAGEYLIKRVTGGTSGLLSYGGGTVVLVGGTVSQDGWKAKSLYTGKTMNYAYFAKNMGVATSGQASDWAGDAMTKPAYNANKVFYYQDPVGTASLAAVWNVANGQKYVVFVNGDLEIDQNINVAPGGFLAFIVSGEITVDPAVTYMEGLFVSNGNFSTISQYELGVTNDVRLLIEGSVVTWGAVDLNRNLGDLANATLPAEQVTYRTDLLTNMPDRMKSFALEWKEVPAGTFGN